jgi:hypothetical protein
VPLSVTDEHRTRSERTKLQGVEIQMLPCAGIGREKDLKTPVQQESVGAMIGPDPTPNMIGCFEHTHFLARLDENFGACESSNPGTYNQDHRFALFSSLTRWD